MPPRYTAFPRVLKRSEQRVEANRHRLLEQILTTGCGNPSYTRYWILAGSRQPVVGERQDQVRRQKCASRDTRYATLAIQRMSL